MFIPPPAALSDLNPDGLFSLDALRRAWQQVRRSGESPGSDRVKIADFEKRLDTELNRLRDQILNGSYQPQPVKRFYIKKASGKQRPISLWSLRDRVAQRVVHDWLLVLFEPLFLECSYGFRLGRNIEQAVQAISEGREAGLHWVLDTDIADCFSSIPLNILSGQLQRVVPSKVMLWLIELWLHTPVQGIPHEIAGVSQGGVISPLLANLYLHRFDEMIVAALPQSRLIRFADDFILLSRTEKEAVWSLEVARRSLENLRLALNPRKTRLITFEDEFIFLGVTFKGSQVIRPSSLKSGEE